MPISVQCKCGKKLNAPDAMAGKKAKCPACQTVVTVPEPLEIIEDEVDFVEDFNELDAAPPLAKGKRAKIEKYDPVPEEESDAPEQTSLDRKLSGDTHASNPGNVKVDYLFTFMNYPGGSLIMIAIGMVFMAIGGWYMYQPGSAKTGAGLIALGVASWALCVWAWYVFGRLMIYGCANPGIVVDPDQGLVAVLTDLDCGIGEEYMVIKIVKQPLSKMTDGPPEEGMRLGTVAGYQGNPQNGHWDTFEPHVVNCITRDKTRIKKVLATFSARDWAMLREGLEEVPTPYQAGQWRVLQDMDEDE